MVESVNCIGQLTDTPSLLLFQTQMCSASIVDVLQTVVSGSDGCVFSYGHAGLGKTHAQ